MMSSVSFPLLLVLCTGNVCRSPMAETLFRHYLARRSLQASVMSRGLAAAVGSPPHRYAVELAMAHGTPLPDDKRAGNVTSAEIAAASAIFIMDQDHRREMRQRFPAATGKVFLLGHWQGLEIIDPLRMPFSIFESTWRQIDVCVNDWVNRLQETGMVGPIAPNPVAGTVANPAANSAAPPGANPAANPSGVRPPDMTQA